MIGEAVSVFRGDVVEGQTELRLEIPVDARIPDTYVESERLRLEAYQKLSVASSPTSTPDQIDLVRDELVDRYGELPAPVATLLDVSRLRRRAYKAGLSEVVAMGPNLRLTPLELPESKQVRLQRMYPGGKYVAAARVVTVPLPPEGTDLVGWVSTLFDALLPASVPDASVASAPNDENTANQN